MKKIVTIQDISCVGKCSLTVALPLLSAMGLETAIIPTAVLSNHTAFSGFTFHDLTDTIPGILDQWKKEGFVFDAVYSGYLGSLRQIELVERAWDSCLAPGGLKIVDPAMADNGSLYKGFTEDFARAMGGLCGKADLIMPNLTEACFMTGRPYRPDGGDSYVRDTLRALSGLGCRFSMLTGVSPDENSLGAMIYDRDRDIFLSAYNEKLPVRFHGTGDIFASVMTGGLVRGKSLEEAMSIAVDFVHDCILETISHKDHNWYGVDFEAVIPALTARL